MVDMVPRFMDNAPPRVVGGSGPELEIEDIAGVMELVDVPDSKSGASDGVRVRVPPPAPY